MDAIISAHASLEKKGNLTKALTSVHTLIDQLQQTRDAVASSPELTPLHMAKLKQPIKASFDKIEEDLKEVNKGLNQYQKALREKFKNSALPGGVNDVLGQETGLVDRAIAMHLVREGQFGVARTFLREINERGEPRVMSEQRETAQESWIQDFEDPDEIMEDLNHFRQEEGIVGREDEEVLEGKGHLQRKFAEMYHILDALRTQRDLGPAIAWAKENSVELEGRGSNLEFELARLKFVELYTSSSNSKADDAMADDDNNTAEESEDDEDFSGPLRALEYAQTIFPTFSTRYSREISSLLGSLAFSPSLDSSPYRTLFSTNTDSPYTSVSDSFTREFTSMLGLSSTSPLYTACTAGGIALPILEKVERVMAASRGQWTSVNELPVETPLPPGMQFHSIFVCPVSKEQATDANPPMMLPCGHVIAKDSLEMHARGKTRMKCPYCPQECLARDAKRVYI